MSQVTSCAKGAIRDREGDKKSLTGIRVPVRRYGLLTEECPEGLLPGLFSWQLYLTQFPRFAQLTIDL